MSDTVPSNDAKTIDRLCDDFEAEWKAQRRQAIESYLDRVAAPLRPRLLRKLLAVEMEYRLRQGERLTPGEYQQRFPQNADTVAAVFAKSVSILASTVTYSGPITFTLKVTEGPNQGESFLFAVPQIFLLGRSKKAHLAVQDNFLSRFHFMIEVNPPICRLTDLQSRNGTWVNGNRVQSFELRDGDTIKVGHTVLQVCANVVAPAGEEDDAVTTAVSPETPPTSKPSKELDDPYKTQPPPDDRRNAPDLTDPELPLIEGYRLERELGRGGMGVVYLARRLEDNLPVALKTIKPAVTVERRQLQRFLREVNILGQLKHHHIVEFLSANECDGLVYFAMEYIEGTDAARMLKQEGRLGVQDAVRMVCQLLSALKYAHEKQFVHRDIKPANLLIAVEKGKKSIKLADFGLARVYQESQLSGLTMLGEVGGTLAFMPPEQITNFRQVTPAADQYSAAATLYNLLTGQLLFDFKSAPEQAITFILQEQPLPIRQCRPELPGELAAVIHRALAKEPEERFANIQEFRTALLPFAASS
jgi:eukaryotic-like serine/threonine-protein kinase